MVGRGRRPARPGQLVHDLRDRSYDENVRRRAGGLAGPLRGESVPARGHSPRRRLPCLAADVSGSAAAERQPGCVAELDQERRLLLVTGDVFTVEQHRYWVVAVAPSLLRRDVEPGVTCALENVEVRRVNSERLATARREVLRPSPRGADEAVPKPVVE